VGVLGRIAAVIEVLILSFEILLQSFAEDGLSGAVADGRELAEAFGEIGVEFKVGGHFGDLIFSGFSAVRSKQKDFNREALPNS
jgi:hypothetical protein